MLCYKRGRMWLPKTSLLLLLLVGLASSERNNEDDVSSVFIEEAKNLFSQKSIERMAHAFAHSDGSKQVGDKNSCISGLNLIARSPFIQSRRLCLAGLPLLRDFRHDSTTSLKLTFERKELSASLEAKDAKSDSEISTF